MRNWNDWSKRKLPPLGSTVCDKSDPRHCGTLKAYLNGTAVVVWSNGWKSHIPTKRLQVVTEES